MTQLDVGKKNGTHETWVGSAYFVHAKINNCLVWYSAGELNKG